MAPDLPSIELLDATHKFPCVFHFKAIGLSTDCFTGRVLDAVKRELPEDAEPSFSTRATLTENISVSRSSRSSIRPRTCWPFTNSCGVLRGS